MSLGGRVSLDRCAWRRKEEEHIKLMMQPFIFIVKNSVKLTALRTSKPIITLPKTVLLSSIMISGFKVIINLESHESGYTPGVHKIPGNKTGSIRYTLSPIGLSSAVRFAWIIYTLYKLCIDCPNRQYIVYHQIRLAHI